MVFFTVPEEHQETFYALIREIVQSEKYQQLGANFVSMDGPYEYDPKIKGLAICQECRKRIPREKLERLGGLLFKLRLDVPEQDFLLQCRNCGATFKRPLELSEDAVKKGTPTKRCHICGSWEFKKIPKKKH